MSQYVVTGTTKTGKREVIGKVYDKKIEAEQFMDDITFGNWKRLPKGVSKQQAQNIYKYKNVRVKKIL